MTNKLFQNFLNEYNCVVYNRDAKEFPQDARLFSFGFAGMSCFRDCFVEFCVYSNVPLVVCGVLLKIMSFFSNTRRRIPYIIISKCSENVRVLIFMPTKICNIFERIKSFLTYLIF